MPEEFFDLIIIGAGAAGLMCASIAGQNNKRVLLIDHATKVGKKILISGGGRCNFTNLHASPENYISQNPHFCKSALAKFTPYDFLELVERYNIPWHEKTLGQLFCDGSAREIVELLLNECHLGKVDIRTQTEVQSIDYIKNHYVLNSHITSNALVIATGGPSIPKMGATDFAYKVARQFGLKVVEPRPALVPFLLSKEKKSFFALSGISTEVILRCQDRAFREALLFTHKGLSGPAALQISSYWRHGDAIHVNFLPDLGKGWLMKRKLSHPNTTLLDVLQFLLPNKLADFLCEDLEDNRLIGFSDKALQNIETKLSRWEFLPTGSEGFRKAEVCLGGVNTNALSSKTMEVKSQPGLYFIGECVDVTGWLGGFNFQWAWASAFAAASAQ